jgi:hypothetical protein
VLFLTVSLLDNADAFFGLFKLQIDNLVKGDEQLVKLLEWADNKAKGVEGSYKVAALRGFYCGLFLNTVSSDALDRAIAFAIALDRARAIAIAHDLNHDLDRAIGLACAAVLDHATVLDLNLKTDLLLSYSLRFAVVFNGANREKFQEVKKYIARFSDYFKEVVNLSQQAGFSDLYQILENLTVPNENDRQSVWQPFVMNLREIMQTQRDIGHKWNLTGAELQHLKRYFQANLLLVECLKLAVVSDREGIERSLLTVGSGE